MTQDEFDVLFKQAKSQFLVKDESQIKKMVSEYVNSSGTIDMNGIAAFAYIESIKYTNDLVYSLLSKLIEENDKAHQ